MMTEEKTESLLESVEAPKKNVESIHNLRKRLEHLKEIYNQTRRCLSMSGETLTRRQDSCNLEGGTPVPL